MIFVTHEFSFLHINKAKIHYMCVWQRHRPLADRRVSPHPAAGWKQMHLHYEDGALGDAVDRHTQPEIQCQQSDR